MVILVILLDVGITFANVNSMTYHAKQILGSNYQVYCIPTTLDMNGKALGSAMVLSSRRLQHILISPLISLGTLIQIKCTFNDLPITITGIYYPQNNHQPGAMLSKLSQVLQLKHNDVYYSLIHEKLQDTIIQESILL